MKHSNRRQSRELKKFIHLSDNLSKLFQPLLGITLLSMLPAFLYSCDPADISSRTQTAPMTKISLSNPAGDVHSLDVFVFNDDEHEKLDCYQRFDDTGGWKYSVVSSSGKRIMTAIANSPYSKEDWFTVTSRQSLNEVHMNLEDENRESMIMVGEMYADTRRQNGEIDLQLRALASEVRLNSILCDFTGKAYEGEVISDAKVYLTNVNAECKISGTGDGSPIRIINAGELEMDDVGKFKDPGLITATLPQPISRKKIYPEVSLRCYQSSCPEETPGTPYTRLVIEGKISGRTYYWPININRDTEEETGIISGRCYTYDIIITRKGTMNPDTPVTTTDIIISKQVSEWKEKKEYEVIF